ncbi:3-dehydrosphinganine reductase [Coniosporium apollinis]|uniref:3-dehydrosphinganine reductase n=1 Tax=Coniosporium apollinis TaxID=61459 RepID=A0ABQ9NRS1_9PEZI|nr:3-dehydrosphinganine reductase [Coniosporium apollinis]
MGFFIRKRKNHFPVDGRTVVITGGSQGMGRGLAKLLAKKGSNVVIVARDVKKLQAAIEYISAAAANPQTQRFHYISADLTNPSESVRVIEEVTAWNNGQPPDIVWANAGTARPGLFVEIPIETLRAQMDANYWTATYLAHATLNCWLKPASAFPATEGPAPTLPRHFVITSSSLAFCGIAGYSAYSPAKAALRSLSDSLRSELNLYAGARRAKYGSAATAPPADIKIHSVYPGTILSPGHAAEEQSKHPVTKVLEEGDPAQTEDQVAAVAVRELEKGGYLISTQFLGSAMRASALQGSPRNNWFVDTVFSWATSIAWLFIGPDMEGKVYKWGKENGMTNAQ